MITEKDLREAIAECQGQRNPNANTCVKLAAYYALLDRLEEKPEVTPNFTGYSFAAPTPEEPQVVDFDSSSEFSRVVDGMNLDDVWPVIEELMDVIQTINPKLYRGVIRKLQQSSGER